MKYSNLLYISFKWPVHVIREDSRSTIVVLIAPRMRTRLANKQPSLDVDGAFIAADLMLCSNRFGNERDLPLKKATKGRSGEIHLVPN
jgi:hypothetical protein